MAVKKVKLTRWFPGDVKPARVGLYELRRWVMPLLRAGTIANCAHWDGERWCFGLDRSVSVDVTSEDAWRGLAEQPK